MDFANVRTYKITTQGTSLVVQWLRLSASSARGMGSVTGLGTKIPYALWYIQKLFKESLEVMCLPLYSSQV